MSIQYIKTYKFFKILQFFYLMVLIPIRKNKAYDCKFCAERN